MSTPQRNVALEADPLWFKTAVIYQVHVRAFADSNGDGIGDFPGLLGRLDYIRDLGATAIWLLPFYPSPLRDAGYDIADYREVNPDYGTLDDVGQFVKAAHDRGIRVITELVLNHTSDQHPWFQRARRAPPGSPWRDWFVWTDDRQRYKGTRIIFTDYEQSNWSWDPVANAYYWHRFYHHQPDLNWDNPAVRDEMFDVLDFWLGMGIDGVRLDAVPYLIEREGTTCENLPETHQILKDLRAHVDARFADRMLLAEANQWPEDAAAYFGEGDECHMNFHFPLMPRLFMAIQAEERYPIIDILEQTPELPEGCQWAVFLRNHDELTLEMVTDEERDYMYRKYAANPRSRINLGIRRRLAPLLSNDRRKIELANGLLLSLAGTPIVYYGDEIGMGDNIYLGDRDGVRSPMQWNADRNAGFSTANPQQLYLPVNIDPEYRYEAINVETQQANGSSLYWWMKQAIALRQRYPVFGVGALEFLLPDNPKVLAFLRRAGDATVLVVANLARSVQYVELDLSALQGRIPRELFGGTRFPPIGELPYLLTIGPHGIFWFDVGGQREQREEGGLPVVESGGGLDTLLGSRHREALETALARTLPRMSWFAGKERTIDHVEVREAVPIPCREGGAEQMIVLILARVVYDHGDAEDYSVPLAWAEGDEVARIAREQPSAPLIAVRSAERHALLYDAMYAPGFARRLLELIEDDRAPLRGWSGELAGVHSRRYRELLPQGELPDAGVVHGDQSNTSVVFDETVILKLFRRVEPGLNPEYEIGLRLTDNGFDHVAAVAGAVEYRAEDGGRTVAIVQEYVSNEGDAWHLTQGHVERFLREVLESPERDELAHRYGVGGTATGLAAAPASELSVRILGNYLDSVELLGRRIGELHAALAAATGPAFAPAEITGHYLRGLFQSMRQQASMALGALGRHLGELDPAGQRAAEELLRRRDELLERMKRVVRPRMSGLRIRCHGDLHLGQVLYTGRDFVIIDFEGEPDRSLGTRRLQQSPLRDVAGMLRSFDYAAEVSLLRLIETGSVRPDSVELGRVRGVARAWALHARGALLRGYFDAAGDQPMLPETAEERAVLLDAFVLEKATYELTYELGHRPHWVVVPIAGILDLLVPAPGEGE